MGRFAFGQEVKVMSYNLRVDFGGDGENNWEFRRDFLADQIRYNAPDFLGTQEGKAHQLQFIEKQLEGYAYIGISRDNSKTEGEFSAIFYNTKKFKVLAEDTFWLSDTPDVKSKGWDAALERICTYGLFQETASGKKFYVFNTHLDHVGEVARANSAKLIVRKIAEINKENWPVVVTGDFNSEPTGGAYKNMIATLTDSKTISETKPFGPSGTFNAFKFHEPVTTCIDYIFVSGRVRVLRHAVLSDSKDCRYPSDHLPVFAALAY
ncbi:endonuclease/exonuclease/phosphatase family protein [Flavobacterium longum]|uniref:endonuclease/exonuclease/phosphatase family protein n=1 Tax=Flavobacterium longum TaxID=1299340 RepID=UPI0039ECA24B